MQNQDKAYHFIAGLVIALAVSIYSPILGLCLGVVSGVAKEVYDYKYKGTVDAMDAIVTFMGAMLAYQLVMVV